jgi:hypothetical protein
MRRLARITPLVSLAVSFVFSLSFPDRALAQKKGQKEDDKPSAAATWSDPVESEKSDKGPFAPQTEGEEGDPEKADEKEKPTAKNAPDRGRKRDKLVLFGQIIIGFGKAPRNKPDYAAGCVDSVEASCGKGTAIGFQLGGRYDITPAFTGGLRVPLTTATVRQETGKSLATTAFGSPELMGEYRVSLSKLSTVPIEFGIGIPVAQGNPDATDTGDTAGQAKDTVNRLADATSGWRDSELFQPKRLPIVLGGGIRHERSAWEVHANAKFVLLPALSSDVSAPQLDLQPGTGEYKVNGFAMREVTTIGGTYNFLDSPVFWGGLDLAVIWTPIETFDFEAVNPAEPSSVQAVLEPRVGVRFSRFEPSVGYIAPLGGRLGSADVGGIRLHLDVSL